jgi:hypothetical protein
MKTTILVCKQNADGTEEKVSEGHANDQQAIKSIKEPGSYIFYPVYEFTKDDLKKED